MRCRELSSDGERLAFYPGHHPAAHQYLVALHAFLQEGSCGHLSQDPLYCQAVLYDAKRSAFFVQSPVPVPVASPSACDMKTLACISNAAHSPCPGERFGDTVHAGLAKGMAPKLFTQHHPNPHPRLCERRQGGEMKTSQDTLVGGGTSKGRWVTNGPSPHLRRVRGA